VRLKCPSCQPHEACHADTVIDELCRREGGLRVTTAERLLAQRRWRETRAAAEVVRDSASAKSHLRLEDTRVGDYMYYADLLVEAADRGVHALEATIYAIAAHGNAAAVGSKAGVRRQLYDERRETLSVVARGTAPTGSSYGTARGYSRPSWSSECK
jgi:hypothetical protein